MSSVNPATVIALTEGIISLIDLFDRLATRQIDDPAELEEYISTRTQVRRRLMAVARGEDPDDVPGDETGDESEVES